MTKLNCILLVDDDYTSNYLSRVIIESADFADHIHVSLNGAEALQFIENHCSNDPDFPASPCPELIFLDINMPVMDGFAFLEELQKMQRVRNKNIPIVMLTSSDNHDDLERAKQFNVAGYLDKPLTEEKIRSLVNI